MSALRVMPLSIFRAEARCGRRERGHAATADAPMQARKRVRVSG